MTKFLRANAEYLPLLAITLSGWLILAAFVVMAIASPA